MIFVYIVTTILVIISILFQGHLGISGTKPDLLFIIVVYMAYSFGSFYGQVTGFCGGLLLDADSGAPLGLFTFSYIIAGFVVGMFGRSVFRGNFITIMLLLFVASFIKGILTLFICYSFDQVSFFRSMGVVFTESLFNAFLAPLFFFIFDKLFARELEREGYM